MMLDTKRDGGREKRIGGASLLVALGLGAALCCSAGRSDAQILDAWSLWSGIDTGPNLAQARLDALGGMREAVPDENREINLLDFAGNVTGELDDKPMSHIDAYGGPRRWFDQNTPDAQDEDFRTFPAYFKYNALPSAKNALGGQIFLNGGSGERLITPDFREQFRLPVENSAFGTNEGSLLSGDLSAQLYQVHYARHITDWLAAGVRAGYGSEEEQRRSSTLYHINHDTDDWGLEFGVAGQALEEAGPVRNLVLLHIDTFAWDRPQLGFDLHALGEAFGWVKGGLNYRYHSFDGQEDMSQNWSAQFPLNPTPNTIIQQLSSFSEGFRESEFEARFQARPPDWPATLGLGFELGQSEYWLNPFENINSFQTAKNERLTSWRLTGGGSMGVVEGKGLVAAEMSYGLADRDDRVTLPTDRVGSSAFELGGAVEYAVRQAVVGRAGYRLILEDEDRDQDGADQELTTQRIALGGGLRAPNGQVFIDAAFQYDFLSRGEDPGEDFDGEDRSNFTLQLRTLF
jgi:hypothetical protein